MWGKYMKEEEEPKDFLNRTRRQLETLETAKFAKMLFGGLVVST